MTFRSLDPPTLESSSLLGSHEVVESLSPLDPPMYPRASTGERAVVLRREVVPFTVKNLSLGDGSLPRLEFDVAGEQLTLSPRFVLLPLPWIPDIGPVLVLCVLGQGLGRTGDASEVCHTT